MRKMILKIAAAAIVITSLTTSASATTYEYDALHRLTRVTYDSGTVIEYTYDAVGNRITKRITH